MKIKPKPQELIAQRLRRLELPYSEVCMHMHVAGKEMWGLLISEQAVQLYDDDCKPFSFPIGRGEAGWDWWQG